MRYRVALGVIGALVGAFIGPDVAFADDCSGLADCFGTVTSAVASLAGGALVLAGAAALSSRLGQHGPSAGAPAPGAAEGPSEDPLNRDIREKTGGAPAPGAAEGPSEDPLNRDIREKTGGASKPVEDPDD